MTLQELKQMVAEEYSAYKRQLKEQDLPPIPGDDLNEPTIAVSDDDIDTTGGDDAEGTLKDIFDMLKDYFEGEAKEDDDSADDTKTKEDEEEDVTEGSNSGYKPVKESLRRKKKANIINEIKNRNFKSRFQKLANIK